MYIVFFFLMVSSLISVFLQFIPSTITFSDLPLRSLTLSSAWSSAMLNLSNDISSCCVQLHGFCLVLLKIFFLFVEILTLFILTLFS